MAVCKVNAPRVETLSVSLTGQTGQVNYRKGGLRTSEENRIEMNWNWTCQLQGKTNKQKKQNTKLQGWISHYGAEMFYLALNSSRKIFLSGVTKLMLFCQQSVDFYGNCVHYLHCQTSTLNCAEHKYYCVWACGYLKTNTHTHSPADSHTEDFVHMACGRGANLDLLEYLSLKSESAGLRMQGTWANVLSVKKLGGGLNFT